MTKLCSRCKTQLIPSGRRMCADCLEGSRQLMRALAKWFASRLDRQPAPARAAK